MRARLLVASLRQADLPVAAAALAAALTHDAIAARTIDTARAELPVDVEALAAAFASNLPEQKAEPPAKPRRARKKRPKERPVLGEAAPVSNGHAVEVVGATVVETGDENPSTPPDGAPARKRRRRRRRRKGAADGGQPPTGANGTTKAESELAPGSADPSEAPANGTTQAPGPPRPRRRRPRTAVDAASLGLPPKPEEG